jgi:hypothetical protein
MTLTLKQQIAADVPAVFLNEDEFGEGLVFLPKGGPPRTIVGSVEDATSYPDNADGVMEATRLEIFVSRDRDDEETGGIDAIAIGDGIRRATDPEAHVFAFTGDILDADESSWTLVFQRVADYELGGNRLA